MTLRPRGWRAGVLCAGLIALPALAQEGSPGSKGPAPQADAISADDAKSSINRAVKFLLGTQNADGSWGTSTVESLFEMQYSNASFYAWKMAGGALCCMALMAVDETPERRDALERALRWTIESPLPKRGSDWDIDNTWTGLYAFVMLDQAARDPRFQAHEWKDRIQKRGLECYDYLVHAQDPKGGWGYYEGPVVSQRPTWSTSFATACVIPALVDAKNMGWPIDPKVIDRAVAYVKECGLPTGAYTYDLDPIPRINGGESINDVKGSLGRIQVCNWALKKAGVATATDEKVRAGLESFFKHHKFLDVARMTVIPHEAYYRNAGYFYFFGHYHAALAINTLPAKERDTWHARLRGELVKCQFEDGSSIDFPGSFYVYTASTSFSILALEAGLHDRDEPRK